jgi:pyruvate dehydrogenase kinase 2/3/4
MQTLPYLVLTNPSISCVYDLYYKAFEKFRAIPAITSLKDNVTFCEAVNEMLQDHLSVIPKLVTGIIESQDFMPPNASDDFITSMLRSVSLPYYT